MNLITVCTRAVGLLFLAQCVRPSSENQSLFEPTPPELVLQDKIVEIVTNLPTELHIRIASLILCSGYLSVFTHKGSHPSLMQVINWPKMLAAAVGHPELEGVPLGPELPRLLKLFPIMGHRFHLVFSPTSKLYPESEATILLVITLFKSLSWRKRIVYFLDMAVHLEKVGKFKELSFLFEQAPDDLIYCADSRNWSRLLDFGRAIYKVAMIDPNSALRIVLTFDDSAINVLFMFMIPMNDESFISVQPKLMDALCKYSLAEIAEDMIEMSGKEAYNRHFPRENECVYMRIINMLNHLETRNDNLPLSIQPLRIGGDENFFSDILARRASYKTARLNMLALRIIYAIHLHVALDMQLVPRLTQSDCAHLCHVYVDAAVSAENYTFFELVREANGTNQPSGGLMINRLFPSGWHGLFKNDPNHFFKDLLTIEQLFFGKHQLNQYSATDALKAVRVYKCITGSLPDEECLDQMNQDIRLYVMSEMYDYGQFVAAVRRVASLGNDNLPSAACHICTHLPDPIPFVAAILLCISRLRFHDSASWTGFLCALTRNSLPSLGSVALIPHDFFVTLFKNKTLISVFTSHPSLKRCVRLGIQNLHELFSYDTLQITALFSALQITVSIDETGFSIPLREKGALSAFERSTREFTLAELDTLVQQPGFWALLALQGAKDNVVKNEYYHGRTLYSHWQNPLCFDAFNLLYAWSRSNPATFIRFADWRIVLPFFSAEPEWSFVRMALRGEPPGLCPQLDISSVQDNYKFPYPASLDRIATAYYSGKKISFKFPSESTCAEFKDQVEAAIGRILADIGCELVCTVANA